MKNRMTLQYVDDLSCKDSWKHLRSILTRSVTAQEGQQEEGDYQARVKCVLVHQVTESSCCLRDNDL